ncbi:AMP-binding protein [Marinobacter sediminum]|uniref:AMP-binding protein n=1 Tax=Marinobacter sediminum TaxID=256323 RepID=UPI001EEDE6BB|nr:AMP-binding protein [Marinobacter sediminum]
MATLPELLVAQVERTPDRLALRSPNGVLGFRALHDAATDVADRLREQGVERLGLGGDNTAAWVIGDLACLIAGVVCVPVPVFFSPSQTDHLIARAGLDGLLWADSAEGRERLGHGVWLEKLPVTAASARMPERTAKITFTSGSTGTPRGVCLSAEQMAATTLALRERLQRVELRHHLCILPLATLLENIAGVYLPLLMGATVELAPLGRLGMTGSSGLDAPELIAGLNRIRPDSVILVPELASLLVDAAERGSLEPGLFRFLAVGGGKVSPDLLLRGRAAGFPLYEGYGLSECGSVVALNVPGQDRPGTVGRPLGHVQLELDGDRQIRIRGNTHLGYLGDEALADGILDTGDLGELDDDGFLRVDGRSKNLLITSFGRNVSPEWLESELIQAAGARQAVVFGDGEPQLRALITVTGGQSPEQISEALSELNHRLPDYARLATVYICRQLLSQTKGHITANGRPVRDQIQSDLPALLADTHPTDMTTSPTT